MKGRLHRLGIFGKDDDPDLLTSEERVRFARLDVVSLSFVFCFCVCVHVCFFFSE